MRYILKNRYYGHTVTCDSEKAKDKFIQSAKKDPKDNLPVWVVSKELPDKAEKKSQFTKEELEQMLADLAGTNDVTEDPELEELKRTYLLKTGKEAHKMSTVNSLTKKLKELDQDG